MSALTKRRIAKIEQAISELAPLGTDSEDIARFWEELHIPGGKWHGQFAYAIYLDWARSGALEEAARRRGIALEGEQNVSQAAE